nr:hypothetical protein [Pyxidicoccus caerfyrddinensis]
MRLLPVQVSRAPVADATTLEVAIPRGMRGRFEAGTDVDYVAALERSAC